MFDQELQKIYLKKLNQRIDQIEELICSGPVTLDKCEEVSLTYTYQLGQLKALREQREVFEECIRTYFE